MKSTRSTSWPIISHNPTGRHWNRILSFGLASIEDGHSTRCPADAAEEGVAEAEESSRGGGADVEEVVERGSEGGEEKLQRRWRREVAMGEKRSCRGDGGEAQRKVETSMGTKGRAESSSAVGRCSLLLRVTLLPVHSSSSHLTYCLPSVSS